MPGFSLSSINFKSPLVWVIIVGGGVGAYLLYQHFHNANASSSSDSSSTPTVPEVGTSLYLEDPTGTNPATPSTSSSISYPGGETVPLGGKTYMGTGKTTLQQIASQEYGKALSSDWTNIVAANSSLAGKTATYKLPKGKDITIPQVPLTSGGAGDSTDLPSGGGIPDTSTYVHVPTWPYGGQMVRSRLG
jgi:hypothetical protein